MKICGFEGCEKPQKSRGYCSGHSKQLEDGRELAPLKIYGKYGPVCTFEGCGRPHQSLGLCGAHNWQLKKGQELRPIGEYQRPRIFDPVCSFEGCDNPHDSLGYCSGHAQQLRKGQELSPLRFRNEGPCWFEGCVNQSLNKGLCQTHYNQQRTGIELRPIGIRKENQGQFCSFNGCKKPAKTKGYCQGHYTQHLKGKQLEPLKETLTREYRDKAAALAAEGLRFCTNCERTLPIDRFHIHKTNGRLHRCDDCQRLYRLEYVYGLNKEAWDSMFESQGAGCALCGTSNPGGKGQWHTDHDHECCPVGTITCGECVRGILCSTCNASLGHFESFLGKLDAVGDYLGLHLQFTKRDVA